MNDRGQTMLDYTLLLGVVIAFLVAISPTIKKGTQAMVKTVADEVGYQQNAEQPGKVGLINQETRMSFDRRTQKLEQRTGSVHNVKSIYNEDTGSEISTRSDLGLSGDE